MTRRARPLAPVVLATVAIVAAAGTASVAGAVGDRTTATRTATAATKKTPPAPVPQKFSATVAADGSISFLDAHHHTVTHLKVGWYTVLVVDDSRAVGFHLLGPKTNLITARKFTGAVLWGVHFTKGTFRYLRDASPPGKVSYISVS